jgi:hypothetical protein
MPMSKRRGSSRDRPEVNEPALTDEEIRASEAGWSEYLAGKSKPLAQVIREQLKERDD